MLFMVLAYQVFLFYSLLITIGVFIGKLSFGQGLGDLGMLFILFLVASLLVLIIGYTKRKTTNDSQEKLIVWLFIFLVSIFFTLHLTIWRGVELPLDGKLFID